MVRPSIAGRLSAEARGDLEILPLLHPAAISLWSMAGLLPNIFRRFSYNCQVEVHALD